MNPTLHVPVPHRKRSDPVDPADRGTESGGNPGAVADTTHRARRMAADCLLHNAKCCAAASAAVAFAGAGGYLCSMAVELAVEPDSSFSQRIGVVAGILSTWTLAGTAALLSIDAYRRRPARTEDPRAVARGPAGPGDPQLQEIN
jgi:hypothetical protein